MGSRDHFIVCDVCDHERGGMNNLKCVCQDPYGQAGMSEPKVTDYCVQCGESPDSGSHLPHGHAYVDPRSSVPMPVMCWCGVQAIHIRFCRDHAPRCRSGAHFDGNCYCKGGYKEAEMIECLDVQAYKRLLEGERIKHSCTCTSLDAAREGLKESEAALGRWESMWNHAAMELTHLTNAPIPRTRDGLAHALADELKKRDRYIAHQFKVGEAYADRVLRLVDLLTGRPTHDVGCECDNVPHAPFCPAR